MSSRASDRDIGDVGMTETHAEDGRWFDNTRQGIRHRLRQDGPTGEDLFLSLALNEANLSGKL